MSRPKLHNYLRTYRKRASLSQDEVASMLGVSGGPKVSRYEGGSREPSLKTALRYSALFGAPIEELFAGLCEKVEDETARRARVLERQVSRTSADRFTARKLATLRAIRCPSGQLIHDERSTR